jgi:hypothetical protein
MKRYVALLLAALVIAALVISCGGGGDGGDAPRSPSAAGGDTGATPGGAGDDSNDSNGGNDSNGAPFPVAGARIEESHAAVTFDGGWTNADRIFGWSGGAARQSNVAGATASFTFIGTSVRWLGSRGDSMGRALVRVDGGPAREVDLWALPNDVIRTPIVTISDLSDGPHTLTIEVLSGRVVVDAFDVQPQTTVSHWQDTDPNLRFSGGWTKASTTLPWSGSGVRNVPDLPVTAQETYTVDETATLPFRGTAISWVGYRGPDGGIALVQVGEAAPVEVDTYSPTTKYQAELFKATGLADANHTLRITATGRRNPASSAPRIVVDAFDVMTPGRRYEEYDGSITISRAPPGATRHWENNPNRVWSEGRAFTSNQRGATLTFRFTGTSVSWIGCRKSSAGGRANVYIDGVLETEVSLREDYPIEGYQMPVFRKDGLAPGPHTLMIEITSQTDGSYVVVDAFDVRQ